MSLKPRGRRTVIFFSESRTSRTTDLSAGTRYSLSPFLTTNTSFAWVPKTSARTPKNSPSSVTTLEPASSETFQEGLLIKLVSDQERADRVRRARPLGEPVLDPFGLESEGVGFSPGVV